jgi:hypothetical protein
MVIGLTKVGRSDKLAEVDVDSFPMSQKRPDHPLPDSSNGVKPLLHIQTHSSREEESSSECRFDCMHESTTRMILR